MMAVSLGDPPSSACKGLFGSSWTHEATAGPNFSLLRQSDLSRLGAPMASR